MQPFITKCCVQKNRFDGRVYMLRLSVSTEEFLDGELFYKENKEAKES